MLSKSLQKNKLDHEQSKCKNTRVSLTNAGISLSSTGLCQDHIYSIGERYPIPCASELIQLMYHCYETRDKIKTSCLPFQFYVSVYWDLITTLGQVQHTGQLSKVSVKIALGKHQLMWGLRDTGGMVVPEGSGFSAA